MFLTFNELAAVNPEPETLNPKPQNQRSAPPMALFREGAVQIVLSFDQPMHGSAADGATLRHKWGGGGGAGGYENQVRVGGLGFRV